MSQQARDLAATHQAAFIQSRPWSEQEFAELLTNRFIHHVGDARCFALIRVIADEAELLTIATHPDHQRQGLARKCMVNWQALAQSLGANNAFLEVAEDNFPARGLYSDSGFGVFGRRKAYYPRPEAESVDALLMKRVFF